MRLAKFSCEHGSGEGIVEDGKVHLLGAWQPVPAHAARFTLPGLTSAQLQLLRQRSIAALPLHAVELAAPMDPASKVICVGLNFADHAAETGAARPQFPPVFLRSSDSLVGHGQALQMPAVASSYDYEGEIAIVIGRRARRVDADRALENVGGFCCFMDGSVREYQGHSIGAGKNFWRSGAIGPWVATADEVPAIARATIRTRVNGVTVQDANAGQMLAGIAQLVAYCSQWASLEPGDVIASGTPAGIGARRKPALWLKCGDEVEVEVAGVGTLRNRVGA